MRCSFNILTKDKDVIDTIDRFKGSFGDDRFWSYWEKEPSEAPWTYIYSADFNSRKSVNNFTKDLIGIFRAQGYKTRFDIHKHIEPKGSPNLSGIGINLFVE